ncbi:MAG: hypothetical protein KAI24_03315 [Planctomycetes bacterium]|nr:hypothetical protein [Planctomycetota bacterium]
MGSKRWCVWWLLQVVTVAGGLRAQALAWQIPPCGSVEFRRTERARASAPCRSAAAAHRADLDAAMPAKYLPRLAPAPVLCEGELDRDHRALEVAVGDLRDVLRAVAFDLSGRSCKAAFPRLLPFGDMRVSGSWSGPDEQGAQRLEARLRLRAPARTGREPKDRSLRLAALCVRGGEGALTVIRSVDRQRGLVTGFHAECDLVVDEGERRWRRLELVDEWRLVAVRECQDFDFRKRVAAAIESGAGWVRRAVAEDRSFLTDRRGERNYGSGRLALALMTMLHGHVPAGDDVVRRGFAALRRRRLDDAYSLATALMAMRELARRGALTAADRKAADQWLRRLLQCTDPRVDGDELLRFNYTRGPRYDTSLQQYGLLGLRAAQQLELELPEHAFAAAARHLLAVQAPSAGSFALELTDHGALQQVLGTDESPAAERSRARLRGFAYREPDDPTYGAMTSAGVSGLLLARAGLQRQGSRDRALLRRIDDGVRDGMAWLARHFSVRVNPGDAERADNHRAYWLYCLERCCELGGVARLQGRDWYYEGGVQLLAAQRPDGAFRSGHAATLTLDSTCFAVLFLAKASAQGPITGG